MFNDKWYIGEYLSYASGFNHETEELGKVFIVGATTGGLIFTMYADLLD